MRRDQLEHAIRAACQIIEAREVIVVGSQAILGTYSEDDLPAEATMSMEARLMRCQALRASREGSQLRRGPHRCWSRQHGRARRAPRAVARAVLRSGIEGDHLDRDA